MQVLQGDFRQQSLPMDSSVMTLGNFDGVHRGHQFLIDHVRAGADQLGIPAAVLTFSPHPSYVIPGAKPVPLLFPQQDQIEQIAQRGIDFLVIQSFEPRFSQLSPEDFLRQYLFPLFQPRKVILGHDFKYGEGQKGDFLLFSKIAEEFQCEVSQVKPFLLQGETVSSSKIRRFLIEGNVSLAKDMLGRPYSIESIVVEGEQLGRKMGFPTANLKGPFPVLPARGVYLGKAQLKGQQHWAVMNIGVRPTVGGTGDSRVECHILDFIGDIYGESVGFEFFHRIREEKKFSSLQDLQKQIDQDVLFARSWLKQHGKEH